MLSGEEEKKKEEKTRKLWMGTGFRKSKTEKRAFVISLNFRVYLLLCSLAICQASPYVFLVYICVN
jgi:hypothetical protein